jgi:hypothetical protein
VCKKFDLLLSAAHPGGEMKARSGGSEKLYFFFNLSSRTKSVREKRQDKTEREHIRRMLLLSAVCVCVDVRREIEKLL